MSAEPVLRNLRWRLVNRFTQTVVVSDLPHPHQSHFTIKGMQPGAPPSSFIGDFTIPLFAPGSDEYLAAKYAYDSLDYGLRLEAYVEGVDGITPVFGGIIRSYNKSLHSFVISGSSDLWIAQAQRPFPGEVIPDGETVSTSNIRAFMALNEMVFSDAGPYTVGNYTVQGYLGPSGTANAAVTTTNTQLADTRASLYTNLYIGSTVTCNGKTLTVTSNNGTTLVGTGGWSGGGNPGNGFAWQVTLLAGTLSTATDDGIPTLTITGGSGTVVITNSQAYVSGSNIKRWNAEIVGRFTKGNVGGASPESMGSFGIVVATSTTAYFVARLQFHLDAPGGLMVADAYMQAVAFGAISATSSASNVWGPVTSPSSPIRFQLGLYCNSSGTSTGTVFTVNGTQVLTSNLNIGEGTAGMGFYWDPGTIGTGQGMTFGNLGLLTRHDNFANATTSIFTQGTVATATQWLTGSSKVASTFLDQIGRALAIEGWSMRYSPIRQGATRTIGTMDWGAPSTISSDLSTSILIAEGYNLIDLEITGNAETFASDLQLNSLASSDGGGVVYWRNLAAIAKYGVLSYSQLSITGADWSALRQQAEDIGLSKGLPLAAMRATILRTPDIADKFRELDTVLLHCPSLGIYYQKVVVVAFDFTENSPTQQVWFAQFGSTDLSIVQGRTGPGLASIAATYKSR